MAFNGANYKIQEKKTLPVLLLLDVSGSMEGEKIDTLNQCTREMITTFANVPQGGVEIQVGVITFGGDNAMVHTPFQLAQILKEKGWMDLTADGPTPFGGALSLGFSILEDRSNLPKTIYRPAVVVVSDGIPTDEWEQPLEQFITQGRSSKAQRFAVPIGTDVHLEPLLRFTETKDQVLQANSMEELREHFTFITQTVSQRSGSVNPNLVPNKTPTASTPSILPMMQSQVATEEPEEEFDEDFDDDDI